MEVNEEEVEWRTEGETPIEEEGGGLDPEQVTQGREEDLNDSHRVQTQGMFQFGAWEEATSIAGRVTATTKWIDRVTKDDDGREFIRYQLRCTRFSKLRCDGREIST